MKYYPLSQIQTGLTSKPGEFKILNPTKTISPNLNKRIIGGEYIGPYIKTSDNKFYTGKSLTDPDGVVELQPLKQELLPQPYSPKELNGNINTFKKKENIIDKIIESSSQTSYYTHDYGYRILSKKPLYSNAPLPPSSSAAVFDESILSKNNGYRYFSKHKINKNIIEISKKTYEDIKSKNPNIQYELYDIMQIKWVISGEKYNPIEYNSQQIKIAESLGFKGLKSFLKNEINNYSI